MAGAEEIGRWREKRRTSAGRFALLQIFGFVHNGFNIGFVMVLECSANAFLYHKAKRFSLSITV
jgi:hypothetical protein